MPSRIENILTAIIDGGSASDLPKPQSRNEELLIEILENGSGGGGVTPHFTIGTVATLEPGSDATASITGTDAEPVLNLGIPAGEKGDAYTLTVQDKSDIADMVLAELPTAVGVSF